MKSILFAILVVISVNVQSAEVQSAEPEPDSRLQELRTQAIRKVEQAIERVAQVSENIAKAGLELPGLRILKEVSSQLQNDSQELSELIEKVNPAKELEGKFKELIDRADLVFEEAWKLQERELTNSLEELVKAIAKVNDLIINAEGIIKKYQEVDLVRVLWLRMALLKSERMTQKSRWQKAPKYQDIIEVVFSREPNRKELMGTGTLSYVNRIRDDYYAMSDELERGIRQFEEAKQASDSSSWWTGRLSEVIGRQERDSLKKLNEDIKEHQGAMSDAEVLIKKYEKERLDGGVLVRMRMEQLKKELRHQSRDAERLNQNIMEHLNQNIMVYQMTKRWEIRYLRELFTRYHETLKRRIRHLEEAKLGVSYPSTAPLSRYRKELERDSLRELYKARQKAQVVMSNAERVIKDSKLVGLFSMEAMEQLKEVLRHQSEDIKFLDEDMKKALVELEIWEIRYLKDCFDKIFNELNRHIKQFEEAKQVRIFNQKTNQRAVQKVQKPKQVASLVSALCGRAFGNRSR